MGEVPKVPKVPEGGLRLWDWLTVSSPITFRYGTGTVPDKRLMKKTRKFQKVRHKMNDKTQVAERYKQALASIPAPGNGCHTALMRPANAAARAGIPEAQAIREIHGAIPEGGRHVPESEVAAAVKRAYADKGKPYTPAPKPPPAAARWGDYAAALIREGAGASEANLWELSPVRIDWEPGPRDAVELLARLYAPDDILFLGVKKACPAVVRPARFWVDAIQRDMAAPPQICPNTFTGAAAPTKDRRGMSCRAQGAVCGFRFVVCESDTMPRCDQIALWYSLIAGRVLDVAALIDTGGKSVHGWVRLDYPDLATWDATIRNGLYAETGALAGMGFDPASKTPEHLSRLPGHFRADVKKPKWQRLLYLNPAGGAP